MCPHVPLTILIDADDTLWENNIYFLRVIEAFVDALCDHGVDVAEARRALGEIERRNLTRHGYGSGGFAHSVREACELLAPTLRADAVERLAVAARQIGERESLDLLPGVRETLEILSRRYRCILVTKGDPGEQQRKVRISGLDHYFDAVEVVAEKDRETYAALVVAHDLDPSRTWMVGNSPRSDINPALAAGLGAILVPHPQTWDLEVEDVPQEGPRFAIAGSFRELPAILAGLEDAKGKPNTA